MTISMREINKLSVSERVILAEKIWENIPEKSDELTINSSHMKELDKRLDKLESGSIKTVTWGQVKNKLKKSRSRK
jgi:putative addiction module component (TIGR02574 family)